MRFLHCIILIGVAISAIYSSGCIEGLPLIGPPVVYPRIVPLTGYTIPGSPNYTFAFQDRSVVVDFPVDAPVYGGAKATDKSARVYDHTIPEQEWREGIYQVLIGDPAQEGFYAGLLGQLRSERDTHSLCEDEYAELLAVSVQSIPYENQNLTSPRFPVETYVDGKGDCDDKSLLLAGLLSREGYRTALLYFDPERRMAVGLGCLDEGYQGTGYAYIETTNVSLVGISPEKLSGGMELTSLPVVIPVGNGTLNYTLCRETAALWQAKKEAEQELALIETEIRSKETELEEGHNPLVSQKAALEHMLSRGDVGGYNRRVAAYNAEVEEYNLLRADLMEALNRFNRLAGIHNYIVTHQHDRKGTCVWFSALSGL